MTPRVHDRYDLGTLYETCKQIPDAMDAYHRALEMDPSNVHIKQRLQMLTGSSPTNSSPIPAPGAAVQLSNVAPSGPGNAGLGGAPLANGGGGLGQLDRSQELLAQQLYLQQHQVFRHLPARVVVARWLPRHWIQHPGL